MVPLQTPAPDVVGDWQGKLNVGAVSLRVVFHLKKGEGGALSGTMDSPDQGARGLPIGSVTLAGDTLTLAFPPIDATFVGTVSADGKRATGTWRQGGQELPLVLERSSAPIPAPRRPQTPKAPFPYAARDVRFASVASGVTLAGTLTVPKGKGPFPAVVLVSGSGPQDRDESLMGHRPFAVLADQLARAGIASLRYDDRGVKGSTGAFATATSLDFADDAEGAVRFLKGRPGIAPGRIGIAGHSEGGLIAPIVAARSRDVGFLVLLAGTGVPGEQVIVAQGAAIMRAQGLPEEEVRGNTALQVKVLEIARTTPRAEEAAPRIAAAVDAHVATLAPEKRAAFDGLRKTLDAQIAQFSNPWFRFFLTYDPRTSLSRVRVPVLVLNGGRDLQVLPGQNVPEIERALLRAGNPRVVVRVLPGLNHLFQHCRTGSPDEYGQIEETFAPEAIRQIVAFVRSTGGRAPGR